MSHLIAPAHTLADNIPLGRRITEIMTEKGPAYTIAAMAKRLGINRETMRLMLKGEREIYTFELEKIAQDLKVPVERILQRDTEEECRRLKLLCINNDEAEHLETLELAKKLVNLSVGLTERCIAENDLVLAYNNLELHETADEILIRIVHDAEQILEKHAEPEIYLYVIGNIMHSKLRRKDYSNIADLVAKAEPYFFRNPRVGGTICFTVARIKEDVERDYPGAREKYDQMLRYYELVNETISQARAQATVGTFEYQQGNYSKAQALLTKAWRTSCDENDIRLRLLSSRDLGRLLIRLDQTQQAFDVLFESLDLIKAITDVDYTELEAQLLLLLVVASKNPIYAEEILCKQIGSISIQKMAAKFLIDYYAQTNDEAAKAKYESIFNQLGGSPLDIMVRYTQMDAIVLLNLFDFCSQHNWHRSS